MTEEVRKHPGCELAGLWWPAASHVPCLPLGAGACRFWPCSIMPEQLLPRVGFGALWVQLWSWGRWPHAAAWLCRDVRLGWEAAGVQSAV